MTGSIGTLSSSIRRQPYFAVAFQLIAGSLLCLASFAGYCRVRHGSVLAGIAALQGHAVWIAAPVVHVGRIHAEQATPARFFVRNLTDSPILVLGAEVGCPCVQPKGLPTTIPPRFELPIEITVRPDRSERGSSFDHEVHLVLGSNETGSVLVIRGDVD